MNLETLNLIIESAKWYPSGDNLQPFKFFWDGQCLEVIHLEQKAKHSLNYKNFSSYITLGAFYKYLEISASAYKYSIEIKNKYEFGAKIKFIPSPTQRSPLFEFLKARNTNRYFFSKANPDVIKKLTLPFENKALFVEKPSIQQLWTVSRLETSILRWPKVFFDLLDTIYLEDDVAPPREGLHWKNVELNILEKSIVHQVRRKPQWYPYLYWSIYWNMLLKNFFKYSLGNGFVVFPFKDFSNQSLVELGETATLFWIMAAQNNLSMQPLTLSSLFHNQVSVEQTPPELPSSVIKVFNNSSKLINESFYWAFRIGKGPLLKGPELTRRLHTSEILSR